MRNPVAKARFDAGAVAPGAGFYALDGKAAIGEKMLHAGSVQRLQSMGAQLNLEEERGADEEVAAGIEHLIDVAAGTVGPEQVLEDLLGDDQVEGLGKGAAQTSYSGYSVVLYSLKR